MNRRGISSILVVISILGLAVAGCVGHGVSRVRGEGSAEQGVYYALPRTVLVVTAPVTRKSFEPGHCTPVLDEPGACDGRLTLRQCLGLGPTPPPLAYSVGQVALSTFAEADPEQVFRIDLSARALVKSNLAVKLSEAGLLLSGTSEVRSRAADLGVGLVKSLSGVASTLAGVADVPSLSAEERRTLAVECADAARAVLAIRAERAETLARAASGAAGAVPAEVLELALEPGRRAEAGLLAAFTGRVEETAGAVRCELRPGLADVIGPGDPPAPEILEVELFRFAKIHGVKPVDPGCVVPEALSYDYGAPAETRAVLRLAPEGKQLAETLRAAGAGSSLKAEEPQGFYYRVPARARVEVAMGAAATPTRTETVLEERPVIAQLGVVAALPRQKALHSKYQVELFEATGALKSVGADAEGVDPALFTAVVDAAGTVLEAERERETEERAAADELARLERERKILEERKKIRDLEEQLGNDDE